MSDYYSTLSGWMIPIYRAMHANNIQFPASFHSTSPLCLPLELEQSSDSRVAIHSLTDLLHYGNQLSANRDFVLQVTEHFHPCVFHALGYAMLSSATLHQALARVVKYNKAVSNSNRLELKQNGNTIELTMVVEQYQETHRPVIDDIGVEVYFTTLVHIARQISGPNWAPKKVQFAFATPQTNADKLAQFFACELAYGQTRHCLVLDQASAEQMSISGNAEVAHLHDKMFDQFLSRTHPQHITNQLQHEIKSRLPLGTPSQSELAKHLGLSLRNMQRKLQQQGTCYKTLLEQVRRQQTMEYLEQAHLSITEIGYLVGFANVGNFNRAFKRWTGHSPSYYRSQLTNFQSPSLSHHSF